MRQMNTSSAAPVRGMCVLEFELIEEYLSNL
jgi:hypothetical protein